MIFSTKITIVGEVTSCSPAEISRIPLECRRLTKKRSHKEEAGKVGMISCLTSTLILKLDAERFSEISVGAYRTTRHYIP